MDEQTNRDEISDRLSARMNQFMYQPTTPHPQPTAGVGVNSVDRLGSVTQKNHDIKMNDYFTSQPRNAGIRLPDIDLRKPINYTVLGKQPEYRATPLVNTDNTNTSDQINQRFQEFTPIGSNRAYPVNSRGYCPIDNKPTATRQSDYKPSQ